MKLKGPSKYTDPVAKALERLLEDTATRNGHPWADWFVRQELHTIICGPIEPGVRGRYRGGGVAMIDPKLSDSTWKYIDIAGCIVHEANHAWWSRVQGTRRNSPEEEADCKKEQHEFTKRVRAKRARQAA